MLVLSRRVDEEVIIGENIRIKVIDIQGNRIRIGIDAPNDVSIRRQEIPCHEQEFAASPARACDNVRPTDRVVAG